MYNCQSIKIKTRWPINTYILNTKN